jgi:hypothetical protein
MDACPESKERTMGERTRKNEKWHLEKETKRRWQEKEKEKKYLEFLTHA